MTEIVVEVVVQAPPVVEVSVIAGGGGGGGGVSTETVQSMINAEVGPTAPDPTLIFDQYLI